MAMFLIFVFLSCINRADDLEYPFGIDISEDGGVEKRIIEPGYKCDYTPQNLSYVTVNYKLALPPNETIIEEAEGFEFQIGIGNVICCWDLALLTMNKGEKALIRCQPEYAYDEVPKNQSGLDPGTVLDFEVEMVSWTKPKKPKKTPNTSGRVECSEIYHGNNKTVGTTDSSDDSKEYAMDNEDVTDEQSLTSFGDEVEGMTSLWIVVSICIGIFVCLCGALAFALGYCFSSKEICNFKENRGIHIQINQKDMDLTRVDSY